MQDVACAVYYALGKVWRGHWCVPALLLCVSGTSTVLSRQEVGIEPLFLPGFCDCSPACARGGVLGRVLEDGGLTTNRRRCVGPPHGSTSEAQVPPPPLAHARPCLSTGWALNRRFEEILGPLFLWSRMGGGGKPEKKKENFPSLALCWFARALPSTP